ncbi:MAG: hypothetical protein VB142_03950 [Burkholderia sp.]
MTHARIMLIAERDALRGERDKPRGKLRVTKVEREAKSSERERFQG